MILFKSLNIFCLILLVVNITVYSLFSNKIKNNIQDNLTDGLFTIIPHSVAKLINKFPYHDSPQIEKKKNQELPCGSILSDDLIKVIQIVLSMTCFSNLLLIIVMFICNGFITRKFVYIIWICILGLPVLIYSGYFLKVLDDYSKKIKKQINDDTQCFQQEKKEDHLKLYNDLILCVKIMKSINITMIVLLFIGILVTNNDDIYPPKYYPVSTYNSRRSMSRSRSRSRGSSFNTRRNFNSRNRISIRR